ncbi:MAG: BA14K family protein [Pseudomonadota bacterium]
MNFTKAAAIAVAITMTTFGYQPVQAAPMRMAPVMDSVQFSQGSNVIEVQRRLRRGARRGVRRGGRNFRRGNRRGRNFRRGVGVGAAIIGGVIIGEAIARERRRERRRIRRGNRHERWCYNRFNSYRAWDNSYQPFRGGRRQCFSPFY